MVGRKPPNPVGAMRPVLYHSAVGGEVLNEVRKSKKGLKTPKTFSYVNTLYHVLGRPASSSVVSQRPLAELKLRENMRLREKKQITRKMTSKPIIYY
jgi:hypothetical protein